MMESRGSRFGVKFRLGFNEKLLHIQEGCDRCIYNRLPELLKADYARRGHVNCTRGRIGAWYTKQGTPIPAPNRLAAVPTHTV